MAKKNQTQAVEVASTAKKSLKVTSTAKKPLKVASTAKKTSEVASTSKKPLKHNVSTAKKKNKQSEPQESSNHDEEEEESDSSSDEEDEPTKDHNKKNQETPPASSESESEAESESESESEAESESESEPEATKTKPPATVSTSASPNKKRQSEEAASTEVKRAKGMFERVWSETDEIVLLQGMIDYKNETGESPYENMSGLYQMVKSSISFDVKKGKQFSSKIWSLKNKYVGKRKNGVEPSFTKPHDLRCLELAKTIWGSDVKKIKLEGGVKLQEGWFERSFLVRVIKDLGGVMVDEATVKDKWSLVPVEAKKRLEEKFMSLQASQLECVFQKSDLLNEVSHVIAKVDV